MIRRGFYIPRKLTISLIFFAVAGGLVYFFFFSDFFRVKEIIIDGAASRESEAELNKLKSRNILLLESQSVEQKIKINEPGILSIEILRGIPDALKIKIRERKGEMLWQSTEKVFLLDENGTAFLRPSTSTEGLPIVIDSTNLPIEGGQKIASNEFVIFIKELTKAFTEKTGFRITKMQIGETTFNLEVFTDAGFRVFFDTTKESTTQLEALAIILKDHRDKIKEYADVRVEGWGYYK